MPPKRPITAQDLYKFQFVCDAQMSPDGTTVLFVHTRFHPDKTKNTYQSHIWKVSTKGGGPRQFTNSPDSESSPRWSPDGKHICFVSSRHADEKGQSQLWVMPIDGGEAIKITDQKHGIGNPKWSPDGKHLLFSSRVPIDAKKDQDKKHDATHITRLSYRFNGQGYTDKFRTHLFVVSSRGGRPKQLTKGPYDIEQACWSPDGKTIYVTGNTEDDTDVTFKRHLYALSSTGKRLKKLCEMPGFIGTPSPSPDGKTIAFVASDLSRSFGTNSRIYRIAKTGGTPECLTAHLDLSVEQSLNSDSRRASPSAGLIWSPDGELLKFIATQRGADRLFALTIKTGDLTAYTDGDHTIESVSYSADHTTAAYTEMTPTRLAELFLYHQGKPNKQLTQFNTSLLSRLRLSTPERFTFTASDKVEVEGWFMAPPASRKKKHPAILQIHGGPRTAYGLGFMHEFQLFTAQGYAVYFINPRGSSSYGEDWASAVGGHYGERDYADVMEAVDHVIKKYPVDNKRLGVTGGSYGGFMTNWIVGHTNRFKAACTQRSISNFVSFVGTSDIGWRFAPEEVGGLPWTNHETYWKRSPLAYAEHMQTPLLIIHSEEDWRCPIEQAEQLFVALKLRGITTELVRFAGENHELSRSGKPKNRLERLHHIARWFNTYM